MLLTADEIEAMLRRYDLTEVVPGEIAAAAAAIAQRLTTRAQRDGFLPGMRLGEPVDLDLSTCKLFLFTSKSTG